MAGEEHGSTAYGERSLSLFITAEEGGVARATGGGEKEKECTTECKSRRRRDSRLGCHKSTTVASFEAVGILSLN